MVPIPAHKVACIAPLFAGNEETMVWSCLQGIMGQAWANRGEQPTAARIITGDFIAFGGDSGAEGAPELVTGLPTGGLLVPPDEQWATLIEQVYGERAERFNRFAFYKDTSFDSERLRAFQESLPSGYRIVPFDEALFHTARSEEWSADLCSQFEDAGDFLSRGIGSAVLYGDELVGGASSYTVYNGGIEIEIDVRKEHRRKGLARACAADLILRCLERGLYPSWDAANPGSAALAEQLGYRLKEEYPTYFIRP